MRACELYVISGPSGVGKSTIVKKIHELAPQLHVSVSFTSRPCRQGECEGEDYNYITRREFKERVKRGEFAEWAEVHGHLYGTPKLNVRPPVLLEIDIQGARRIKVQYPRAANIFVLPPTYVELERRLRNRGRERSENEIARRLATATVEVRQVEQVADFWLVNNEARASASKLWELMQLLHLGHRPKGQLCCKDVLGRVLETFPSNGVTA